ncbi:MAG: alpha-glucan family phosphorylase [Spirochaetes bacterium]|nr:alpha-glucan family phosphorylase [Spirochaetota bacterium]
MATIHKFQVLPYLPEKLKSLMKIASNMWWVWNFEAIELFRRIDVELWREVRHNPIRMLGLVPQRVLDEAAESESFLAHLERVERELDLHLARRSWFEESFPDCGDARIAYFSAEFGIHECLPMYSGGLGVLAGDHLKSSSELGLPLVGVGLMYRFGYFRQYLNKDGWQQEIYSEIDFHNIPASLVFSQDGRPLMISVEYPNGPVFAQIWKIQVGRIELFLLDANVDVNRQEDRSITEQLYGGDDEMRIRQEIMIGIGGVRALRAMNKRISVYHMNEGHAAFLALERARLAMEEQGLTFAEASEFVTATSVFTTHTPVPAGNDRFEPSLIETYFSHYFGRLGLTEEQFLSLGRENVEDRKEPFCMTVLALKMAAGCNGVSKLHGKVSRAMWNRIWPTVPVHEIPVGHITNGVQILSWTSDEMMRLFNRYMGPRWIDNPADDTIWKNIDLIPDSELWRCRERIREHLVTFARNRLREQLLARGMPMKLAERANSVLDPEALTIGFSRRFATYKRATLILRNIDRLERLLLDKERPMQIIFAGKAHPRDNMGKELIKHIVHIANEERFRDKVLFLEDYDINLARYLVQGVDVWLNTPVRPKEASGTSGMKAVPNGGVNISILDGWWDEAYNADNGWAIGKGEEYDDQGYQDEVESLSLYNILESEVKPAFYNRGVDGIPREWLKIIRESMKTICSHFNMNRMVKDYSNMYYSQAHKHHLRFSDERFAVTREVSRWKTEVAKKWDGISIGSVDFQGDRVITVGSKIVVKAEICLGELTPDDVLAELYFGALNSKDEIVEGVALPMIQMDKNDRGNFVYVGSVLCLISGQFGFTVRVLPHHEHNVRKFDPRLPLTWQ